MSAPVYRAAQAAPPMPLAWGCVRVGALGVVGVLLQGTGAVRAHRAAPVWAPVRSCCECRMRVLLPSKHTVAATPLMLSAAP